MKVVERKVYYCDFCKRHRMTAAAIEKHEPRCIYNPDRSACGWHEPHITIPRPGDYVAQFQDDRDLDLLRAWAAECPACMLAVVVQAGFSSADRQELGFDYQEEVARFRKQEAEERAYW